ncbi:MAG: PAS domain-containing protein, partial [Phormidesmis sp.]
MPSIKKDPSSAVSRVSLEAQMNQLESKIKSLEQAHTEEIIRREQVEGELTKAQQLLQLVMDTLPEAIFWKDRHSVYLGCNRNFAEDAGIGLPEKIIGKTDYDLPWKKEESDFFRECDRRVMLADRAELGIVEPLLQGDGKQAWVETNKASLHDENGKVIGILGTYQDITVRKQAEIALHELNQKLECQTIELTAALAQLQQSQLQLVQQEKMSALGSLIAGVAHEMNNPVGFLSGNLRPAQDYVKDLLKLIELYQAALPNPGEVIEAEIEEIDLDYVRQDLPKLLRSMGEGINRIRDISTSLRTFSRADQQHKVAFDLKDGLD